MELPIELKSVIHKKLEDIDIKLLQKEAENISFKYRNESGKGSRLVTKEMEALSYSVVRMPATFGAVYTVLKNFFQVYASNGNVNEIKSLLDVGAGTGTATWAANEFLDFEKSMCLEREDVMLNLGKMLMSESDNEEMKKVSWNKFDLIRDDIAEKADLVICSYVLNELSTEEREKAVKKLWNSTNKFLVIIEPGTPLGFSYIKSMREQLVKCGGYIVAPCPNSDNCLMPENDWCHATCRVSRSKEHKMLKNGDVPYEDEKFSYIVVAKERFEVDNIVRVLRHPKIEPGRISLDVCSFEGIKNVVVTKKDKELFKKARKVNCGDLF